MSFGFRSLAVSLPSAIRTNDYYRERCPDHVAAVAARAAATPWAVDASASLNEWDLEMQPYLDDPFRGTHERRVLAPGQSALDLELDASRAALAAVGATPGDVDLVIASSFLPDDHGVGNAARLARALGVRGPAWNLESTCAAALVSLEVAHALVRAGRYRGVLVAQSCTYSRATDDASVLSWTTGDGACAAFVGPVTAGEGVLGTCTVTTAETCGAFRFDLVDGRLVLAGERDAGRTLRDRSAGYVRDACEGAARDAGVAMSAIDCFVFNTPVAWFAPFAARVLGVDPARTVNAYRAVANIGPALTFANLYLATATGKLRRGDLALVYAIGSSSTASATVVRWGDVRLGPAPRGFA